jgi:hypothetical protein
MSFFSRKNLWKISLALVILLSIGAFGGWYFWLRRPYDAWNLMPNNPVIILESKDLAYSLQELQTTPLWQNLKETPAAAEFNERIQYFLKNLAKASAMSKLFNGRKITISLHLTAKSEFGFLFFVPIEGREEGKLLPEILDLYQKNPFFQFKKRNYRSQTVHEISHPSLAEPFTFALLQGYWVGSYTPILVEDVIRKNAEGESAFTFENQRKIDQMSQAADNVAGSFNVFVNPKQLSAFLKMGASEKINSSFQVLNQFADGGFLNFVIKNKQLQLKGYSFTSLQDSAVFLNIFQHQKPQIFGLKNYLPNNTALLFHFTFSETNTFFKGLNTYQQKENRQFLNQQNNLQTKYDFNIPNFYAGLDKELALSVLESADGENTDKLLWLRTQSVNNSINQLDQLAKKIAQKQITNFYSEKYNNAVISEIKIPEFPAILFGNVATGFKQVFYMPLGSFVVLGNDPRVLKQLSDDFIKGNTWAKSVDNQIVINQLSQAAGFNFAINVSKAWNIMYENASDDWQTWLSDYEIAFRKFQWLSFQFVPEEKQFLTNFNIASPENLISTDSIAAPQGYETLMQANFKTEIFTQPYPVVNHEDSTQEILIQDYMNNLYLISSKGNMLWRRNIGAPIRSQPTQIDIYNNQRLQYLFITAGGIQLIDRLGRNVNGFPLRNPDTTYFNTFGKINLENNQQPYYAASNTRGKVYLFDNQWKRLNAWKPKVLGYRLGVPLQCVRVQDKNYFLAVLENGQIQAFYEDGQLVKGFPITVSGRITNPLWIESSLNLENTLITVLTDYGNLLKINLLGEIKKEDQIFRPSGKAKFWLCPDQKQKDWLIALTDAGSCAVFNKNGEKQFDFELESKNDKWEVQYFNFDTQRIIAFTDKVGGLTYLYDFKGKLIAEPFPSTKAIDLQLDKAKRKLIIYYTFKKKVGIMALQSP